jgi:hypothetical protein
MRIRFGLGYGCLALLVTACGAGDAGSTDGDTTTGAATAVEPTTPTGQFRKHDESNGIMARMIVKGVNASEMIIDLEALSLAGEHVAVAKDAHATVAGDRATFKGTGCTIDMQFKPDRRSLTMIQNGKCADFDPVLDFSGVYTFDGPVLVLQPSGKYHKTDESNLVRSDITVESANASELVFSVSASTLDSHANTGTMSHAHASKSPTVSGSVATFTSDDCTLTMTFDDSTLFLDVKQDGTCGFGLNVDLSGHYRDVP